MQDAFSLPYWFTNPIIQTLLGNLTPASGKLPSRPRLVQESIDGRILMFIPKKPSVAQVFLLPDWGHNLKTPIVRRQIKNLLDHNFTVNVVLGPSAIKFNAITIDHFIKQKFRQLERVLAELSPRQRISLIGLGLGGSAALFFAGKTPAKQITYVLAISPLLDMQRLKHRFFQTARGVFAAHLRMNWDQQDEFCPISFDNPLILKHLQNKAQLLLAKDDPFISAHDLKLSQHLRCDLYEHGGHNGFVTVKGIFDKKHLWLDSYVIQKLRQTINQPIKLNSSRKKIPSAQSADLPMPLDESLQAILQNVETLHDIAHDK